MSEIVGKLRCPICEKIVKLKDPVILNVGNTIMHRDCYKNAEIKLPVKDTGRFGEILMQYYDVFTGH